MGDEKFSGEHLRFWRTRSDLSESFTRTLDRVEDHGCEIWTISADQVIPSFAYTVGVHDVANGPEIITVGLKPDVAHHALNQAFELIHSGTDLSSGRHPDIVGNVDVEFRPVDPKWLHHIMLRADWYYRGENVPVLQLIYPDLQNRFPDDPDFDPAFTQPFLTAESADHETSGSDLWLAHDESSSLSRWDFEDSPHVGAYLSQTVQDGTEPVTYVAHDADGDWQFLGDMMSEGGGPVLSCLHHPVDRDRSLEKLHDLPLGWYAVPENMESPWERFELPPEEHDSDENAKAVVN